ncbi:MAG: glycosyltransferase family 2 protein [Candidatus Cloacimonetes bacterium]|nr:glycosyltransferase family 2 protein [Candidatus Cloacimonadota bacterium]
MNNPKVSVVIPVYNGESYILETIESIRNQTYNNIEIIVVDDGSTDQSSSLVEGKVSKCIRQENRGVASARNRGIDAATGEYLAFIDADDKWDLKKLEIQISFMEAHPHISYTFTNHVRYLTSELDEFPEWMREEGKNKELMGYIPSSLVVRQADFEKIGYFNEDFRNGEDTEWFLRAQDFGFQKAVIPENLLMKRIHGNNLTSDTTAVKLNLLKAFGLSLTRRKQNRISVIIPVYNGEKYLKEAVESALNQYLKPYEIIVVDDGSTDLTVDICKSFGDKIHYFKQEHQGSGAARNLGVSNATGNYLAFLDADDLWSKEWLRDAITAMAKEDSSDIVFGMMQEFYSPDTDDAFRRRFKCVEEPRSALHPGCMLIKRSDFLKVGSFNIEYESGVTVDWLSRIEPKGLTYRVLPGLHMKRRIHYSNNGIIHKDKRSNYAKIIKERLMKMRDDNYE